MGQLIFSPQAVRELKSIYRFIKKDSHFNALRVRDKIIDQAEKLILNPTAGRIIIETSKLIIRQIMVYKYRVFYKQNGGDIEVISIFHSARLLENNPDIQNWFDD